MKILTCRSMGYRGLLKTFFALVFLTLTVSAHAAPTIGAVTVNFNPVAQYTKFELTFPITTWATNLFNPAQISVSATFTGPTGTPYTINGFAYQGYTQSGSTSGMSLSASGSVVWKVRFTPPATGNWSYVITATDTGGTSTTTSSSFTVSASSKHGFVQVSTVDPHYFAYSDGTAFWPVGENMDWPDENFDDNVYWYNDYLPKLAAQGGNWIRVWMSDWCFGIEDNPGTLNNYAQDQAWLLDDLFGQLESSGMVVQLCLDYANQYNGPGGYVDWTKNPYNSANGGPLANDYDIWTNATAQTYLNMRWRYITARWGYSTSLLDYELFNEVDNSDQSATYINNGDVAAWHNTQRNELNSLNPQTHMVSTSFDAYIANQQTTWANLDFTQWHSYGDYPSNEQSETSMDQQYIPTFFGYKNAPDYAGEMGTNWVGPGQEATSDPNGVAIHEENWASLMSNAAGGGFIWWWDNYVDPNNLYFNWKGISSFVSGEDMDKRGYKAYTSTPGNENGQPLSTLYMVGNEKVLGWVEDQNNQWAAKENGSTVGSVPAATQSITGLSPNGSWTLQWWNTTTGVIYSTSTIAVAGGTANLTVPAINSTNPDWAFKLFSAPVTASTWRVNAGGAQYTDSKGNVWAADENYVSGSPAVSTNAITGALPGATDQTLYQDQRYGASFDYIFNVPAGSYQITLKFAETYSGDFVKGARVFNVLVNGTTVLANLDIYGTVGANTALDEVFNNIASSGGTITIQFTGTGSTDTNAQVEAIQIIPQPATATATSTFSKTATATFTLTHSSTPTLTFTSTTSSTFTSVFTSTPTNTLSATATKTNSNTPTSTFTSSYTPTLTLTSTPSNTSTKTYTSTPVNTASPTVTNTNSSTLTASFTATTSSTSTNTPIGTLTPVDTNTPVNTVTGTSTSSPTMSYTFSSTSTLTPSVTNTLTVTSTTTNTSSNTPAIPTSTKTYTFTPSATVTNTPTSTNTVTSTSTSTFTSTLTATPTLTYTFTFTKTASPTVSPTGTATWTNTATSTATAKIPTATYTFTSTPTFTAVPPTSTPTTSLCAGIANWNGNFVYYAMGAKVVYDGELYQCIQAHTSESTWEPNIVPALWKALGSCGGAAPAPALVVAQPVVYPNPVTSSTTSIQLPVNDATNVKVQVYTVAMREVQTVNVPQVFGNKLTVQMMDKSGMSLANGLYYFVIQASGQKWIDKVLVLR